MPVVYVNSLLATLNARGSLLGGRSRRVRELKASFRGSSAPADHSHNQGIEVCRPSCCRTLSADAIRYAQFTTVISADAVSSDSIVETTKIDEESYPYRAS